MVAVLSLIRSQASFGVGSPGTDTNQYSAIALHQRQVSCDRCKSCTIKYEGCQPDQQKSWRGGVCWCIDGSPVDVAYRTRVRVYVYVYMYMYVYRQMDWKRARRPITFWKIMYSRKPGWSLRLKVEHDATKDCFYNSPLIETGFFAACKQPGSCVVCCCRYCCECVCVCVCVCACVLMWGWVGLLSAVHRILFIIVAPICSALHTMYIFHIIVATCKQVAQQTN